MLHKFCTAVGLVAVLALMGACEHIEQLSWKGDKSAAVVDARTGRPEPQLGPPVAPDPGDLRRLEQAPGKGRYNFPPPSERDLMVLADKLGGHSVEIYDLNSGALRTYGGGAVVSDNGLPASADPSVTVYPVDGQNAYPGHRGSWPNNLFPAREIEANVSGSTTGRASTHAGGPGAPAQIFFQHGSSRLGGGDRRVLSEVADKARFAPVHRVSVEGHASSRTGVRDPVQAKIINLKESMNRAFNVSSQLMREGVPAEKIKTTVWGDTKNTGGSEAENRRVDIIGAQ